MEHRLELYSQENITPIELETNWELFAICYWLIQVCNRGGVPLFATHIEDDKTHTILRWPTTGNLANGLVSWERLGRITVER
jgi:hypothetical protein